MHTLFIILSIPAWFFGIIVASGAIWGTAIHNGTKIPAGHHVRTLLFVVGVLFILFALELDLLEPIYAVIAVIVTQFVFKKFFAILRNDIETQGAH